MHGVAVVAAAASVRWGVEMTDAVAALVDGKALHGIFSDYELRFGREEAESDLDAAWQRVTSIHGTPWATLKQLADSATQRDLASVTSSIDGRVDASDFHLDVAALVGFR